MTLGHLWAGRAFGTNTGNLFVRLHGDDAALSGRLHLNEPGIPLVVYIVEGNFDGNRLSLTGNPEKQIEGLVLGRLAATAVLTPRGELSGEWETDIGSAGTFVLFPHDQPQVSETASDTIPDQLHTARHNFGAIEIDREQITALADEIQTDFKNAQLVVTLVAGTEQSRFLQDFKNLALSSNRGTLIKLFVQEPEKGSVNRVVSVELGPQVNMAMTQGADEAWVLGMLEKLKTRLRPFERTYTTNFRRFGFGINQILVVGAIVFLPSMSTLSDRAILMFSVFGLVYCVNWLHSRYLPFATIYLAKRPTVLSARVAPAAVSWLIAVTAGLVATLLAAYLQGWLGLHLADVSPIGSWSP